jgi:hypothetical protein
MKKRCIKFNGPVLSFVVLGALLMSGHPGGAQSPDDTCALVILNRAGKRVVVKAEKAGNEFRRRKGLMFRKNLASNSGMLFIFEEEQRLSFWMKNTYIPLSIAYIDGRGYIRDIYDMKPLDDSVTYPSKSPVKYALEVNRGWFGVNDITPGCRVLLDGCVGK